MLEMTSSPTRGWIIPSAPRFERSVTGHEHLDRGDSVGEVDLALALSSIAGVKEGGDYDVEGGGRACACAAAARAAGGARQRAATRVARGGGGAFSTVLARCVYAVAG